MVDFKGQELSEKLFQTCIVLFSAVAFVVGYSVGSFSVLMYIFGSGVALAAVISVPDYPYLNQYPLEWLPRKVPEAAPEQTTFQWLLGITPKPASHGDVDAAAAAAAAHRRTRGAKRR